MPPKRPEVREDAKIQVISYWVVPGRLRAGVYPGSVGAEDTREQLAGLFWAGIRAFVDLTEPDEVTRLGPLRPYAADLRAVASESAAEACYSRFPIRDLGVPTRGLMISILDAIDEALTKGKPAYVHCLGGRGRTGAVIGCHLVRHAERLLGTADPEQAGALALARITELRLSQAVPYAQDSPQTDAQRALVLGWRPGL